MSTLYIILNIITIFKSRSQVLEVGAPSYVGNYKLGNQILIKSFLYVFISVLNQGWPE